MTHRVLKVALLPLLLGLLLGDAAFAGSDRAGNQKHAEAPSELTALEFLIGDWDLTTSFAQSDGSRRQEKARLTARWAMGGMGIAVEETHGYSDGVGGVFVSTVLYSVHPKTRQIVGASNNTLGNRKTREVTVEDDRIVFIQAGELFEGRQGFNRVTLFNISQDRYESRLDACTDSETPCRENTYSYLAERRQPSTRDLGQKAQTEAPKSEVRKLAERYLQHYVDQDLEACAKLLAEDAEFQDSAMRLVGRDRIVEGLGEVFASLTIDDFDTPRWTESGPRLVGVDGTVRFRQDGAFVGQPGIDFHFAIPITVILEIAEGKVIRHLDIVDVPRYMQQLRNQLPESS